MGKYALLGYGISISAKAEKLSTEIIHLPHPHLRGCLPPGKTRFRTALGKCAIWNLRINKHWLRLKSLIAALPLEPQSLLYYWI